MARLNDDVKIRETRINIRLNFPRTFTLIRRFNYQNDVIKDSTSPSFVFPTQYTHTINIHILHIPIHRTTIKWKTTAITRSNC